MGAAAAARLQGSARGLIDDALTGSGTFIALSRLDSVHPYPVMTGQQHTQRSQSSVCKAHGCDALNQTCAPMLQPGYMQQPCCDIETCTAHLATKNLATVNDQHHAPSQAPSNAAEQQPVIEPAGLQHTSFVTLVSSATCTGPMAALHVLLAAAAPEGAQADLASVELAQLGAHGMLEQALLPA